MSSSAIFNFAIKRFDLLFLGAPTHLYICLCPSVDLLVGWSVTHSFDDPYVAPYKPYCLDSSLWFEDVVRRQCTVVTPGYSCLHFRAVWRGEKASLYSLCTNIMLISHTSSWQPTAFTTSVIVTWRRVPSGAIRGVAQKLSTVRKLEEFTCFHIYL